MSNVTKNILGVPSIRIGPNFNARTTAEQLHKAMAGIGCNKDQVIQALCTIGNDQRQKVAAEFKTLYGKDLSTELKKELSGDFEGLILALMERPDEYDARNLHKAMAGLGTNESVLIEILVSHSNRQIQMIKDTYRRLFGKELEKDIVGDTSGAFRNLLVSLCSAGRDESWMVDQIRANQDARQLWRDGEKKLGTDESTFNKVLATHNFSQLKAVFDEYAKISGHPIEKAIESEFSGDCRDGFMAVIKCVRNRNAFFAELLYNSMKGLGTRDADLIRLVVSRAEVDLADIRAEYAKLYKTPLEKAITDDCSGAYKQGLIALVKGN